MSANVLETLGISQEELQKRLIEKMADELLTQPEWDEDEGEYRRSSNLNNKLQKLIQQRLDEKLQVYTDTHFVPLIDNFLQTKFQETNSWGEPKGEGLTLSEYLFKRANTYFDEKVNWDGKPYDGYNKDGLPSRLMYLVDKNLRDKMAETIKQVFTDVNRKMLTDLADMAKQNLTKMAESLKLTSVYTPEK